MLIKYCTYKSSDFLTDDYFVATMLNPTPESEIYWESLIYEGKIDQTEFISAYRILKSIHDSKPNVAHQHTDMLWKRISETNQKNRSKKRWGLLHRYSVAACVVMIIGISIYSISNLRDAQTERSLAEFAQENVAPINMSNDQIELVSGNVAMTLDGNQANVEYDTKGDLKVNDQSVNTDITENKDSDFNQLCVPYGKRAFLKMSDGTSLWVNSGSRIIYPSTFAKNKREIFVEGEIYAEVAHDATRPFIVTTNKIDVRVLGTVFNVTAYKDDSHVNVVLVSGSVNVKPKNGKSMMIKPNQMFAYKDEGCTLKDVDVENYTSWHNGLYVFNNEPIENVLRSLSRYYNVSTNLPQSVSGITCSGKLVLRDDIDQLLQGLSEITPMSYVISNNECTIEFE